MKEQSDYEYLRDVITEAFDPSDEDIAEVEILAQAIRSAAATLTRYRAALDEIDKTPVGACEGLLSEEPCEQCGEMRTIADNALLP